MKINIHCPYVRNEMAYTAASVASMLMQAGASVHWYANAIHRPVMDYWNRHVRSCNNIRTDADINLWFGNDLGMFEQVRGRNMSARNFFMPDLFTLRKPVLSELHHFYKVVVPSTACVTPLLQAMKTCKLRLCEGKLMVVRHEPLIEPVDRPLTNKNKDVTTLTVYLSRQMYTLAGRSMLELVKEIAALPDVFVHLCCEAKLPERICRDLSQYQNLCCHDACDLQGTQLCMEASDLFVLLHVCQGNGFLIRTAMACGAVPIAPDSFDLGTYINNMVDGITIVTTVRHTDAGIFTGMISNAADRKLVVQIVAELLGEPGTMRELKRGCAVHSGSSDATGELAKRFWWEMVAGSPVLV